MSTPVSSTQARDMGDAVALARLAYAGDVETFGPLADGFTRDELLVLQG